MQLINIGFGNVVSGSKLLAVISPESAPVKRMIQDARDQKKLIDATYGRKTRAVLVMSNDYVVLSALHTETIAGRILEEKEETEDD